MDGKRAQKAAVRTREKDRRRERERQIEREEWARKYTERERQAGQKQQKQCLCGGKQAAEAPATLATVLTAGGTDCQQIARSVSISANS